MHAGALPHFYESQHLLICTAATLDDFDAVIGYARHFYRDGKTIHFGAGFDADTPRSLTPQEADYGLMRA